jgi:hypothetical protein
MQNKPLFLEAACWLSMAGSAVGFVGSFLSLLFFEPFTRLVRALTNLTGADGLNRLYLALLAAAFALSFSGAVKLFRMQRAGLWFYLPAQVLILILPVINMGAYAFSATNLIFTLIFAGVYLFHYRKPNR